MAITIFFRNAVASNNVKDLRIMMKDSLFADLTFAEFEEMNSLAKNVPGLFDPHDGRNFETDRSSWNDAYMAKLMVQVVRNFSHERVTHLKEVIQYLRPVSRQKQTPPPSGNGNNVQPEISRKSYQEQKRQDERDGRIIHKKVIAGGIAGGVVSGGVAAAVGGSTTAIAFSAVAGAFAVGLLMAKITSPEV